jgi:hypothetical protein
VHVSFSTLLCVDRKTHGAVMMTNARPDENPEETSKLRAPLTPDDGISPII